MNLNRYIGKKVKIVCDDANKIVTKFGVVETINQDFVVFKSESGDFEAIPIFRIIRLEVVE